jgi:hypothetical protein
MRQAEKLSLKAFWDTVERRLAECSADELRAILRAMAQDTLPMQRQTFLSGLEPAGNITAALQSVSQEDLLADIDELADELKAEMASSEPPQDEYDDWYEDEYGEYGGHGDEDNLGPYEQFIEPLTALFDRAEAAFDYGDLKLACAAYQKLFEIVSQEDDYGRGVSVADLESVDSEEAVSRYLRAVYETMPLKHRPKTLFEHMSAVRVGAGGHRPTLSDVIEISPKPLPDQERFIEDWIAYLREQTGSEADAGLREAIRLSRGAAGLEELARAEGKKRPRAYLDWLAALESEGKRREALTAAQEALEKLDPKLPIRAAIADHLCAAAIKLKDAQALHAGRWEAFLVQPTLARLLDVWEAVPARERAGQMRQAADHIESYLAHPPRHRDVLEGDWPRDNLEEPAWIDKSVLAHAYLLAQEWDEAHQRAAREQVLGWSSSDNVQGLVTPFFLVLLSGKLPGALPSNLAQLWQAGLRRTIGFGYWDTENEEEEEPAPERDLPKRLERAYADALSAASLSKSKQQEFLSWCLEVAQKRTQAIVGGQHRGSYGKAAVLIAACVETLQLRGRGEEAAALLDDVRNQFPRHRAFQSELDAAMPRREHGSKRKGKS